MLMIPGPVELNDKVIAAQAKQMINHRDKEFQELHTDITKKLAALLDCQDAYVLTGSGTLGIESMISSVTGKDDKMLCLSVGLFGNRFAECARIYCDVQEKQLEWGKGFDLDKAKQAIDESNCSILGMVYNETSTGVTNKMKDIFAYAKKRGMTTLLDAVSAWGGHELKMRADNVDAVAIGSQKCLAAPPGLAIVGVRNDEVWQKIEKNEIRNYYGSLKKCREYMKKAETPFTPAVGLFYAIKVCIDRLEAETISGSIERHKRAGELVRKRVSDLGLELLAEKGFESNTVTSVRTEKADLVKGELKKRFNIKIAGGQGALKGKLIRIAHLGDFNPASIETCLLALEKVLGGLQ